MPNPNEENNKTSYPLHGGIPQGFQSAPTSMEVTQKIAAYEAEMNALRSNLYDCQRDISLRDVKISMLEKELDDIKHILELILGYQPRPIAQTSNFPPYQGPTCNSKV